MSYSGPLLMVSLKAFEEEDSSKAKKYFRIPRDFFFSSNYLENCLGQTRGYWDIKIWPLYKYIKEKKPIQVLLEDLSKLLDFIYTGRLYGKQFEKLSLLSAAKKYQLDSLKDLVILDLETDLDTDMGTAEEPGEADIFIASKLFESQFQIALSNMENVMMENASFKEKMEDYPVFTKIKEKF